MKNAASLRIRTEPDGIVLAIKAVPGSSRDAVVGVLGDALKVATSTAAEKGKANKAIAAILADAFDIDRRRVRLYAGPTSPRKEFLLQGLTEPQLRKKLADL